MRRLFVGLLLAAGFVGAASAQSIGGKYSVAGKNFDGLGYAGTVQITPSGSTCRIAWKTGETSSEGLCMVSNKTLAAFYKLGSDYGVVIYDIQPDGSLKGQWGIVDKKGIGTEVLTPQK